jgi:ATP-dependent RNA helicase DeaD
MNKLFSELGLSAEVLKAIDKMGFEQPSPIQAEAIPLLMAGEDVVGQSMTGSGKTAAFAAPAVDKVDSTSRATQVLILCPTRELAVQVSEEVHKLAIFKRGVHALPIYGGQSYDRQFVGLRQGAQLVIGTPGRVMDHMRRGTLSLAGVKMVVLDEVDVMLNMGFREDIDLILQSTPATRQTVFFSATIPRPIQQLIEKHSRQPRHIRMEQKAMTVPTVEQTYYEVDRWSKVELLTRLIDLHDLKLGIVFCNTKRMVDDLVDHLNAQGYSADRLHGDMTQMMRDRVMNKFRKSGLEFLVATDVAARGIDVDDVQVVFNYDLPYDGEDYVHRIGRTGRQGRSGRAISFVSGREVFQIRNIERYTNTRIHRGKPPTMVEVEEARANVMLERLRTTLKAAEFKPQDHLVERLLEEGFNSTDIVSALLHLLQAGEVVPVESARSDSGEGAYTQGRGDRDRQSRGPSQGFSNEGPRRPQGIDPAVRPDRPRKVVIPPARVQISKPAPTTTAVAAAMPVVPVKVKAVDPVPSDPAISKEKSDASPAEPTPKVVQKVVTPVFDPAALEASRPVPPKPSRRTPDGQTRLFMSVGAELGINIGAVVELILGETGLPRQTVGYVDVRERHTFVDVISEDAPGIIAKLNRTRLKGQRIKVKLAN